MMTLDSTTGLPQLPDGQWWEVRKYIVAVSYPGQVLQSRYEDGYEVCLMGKKFIPGKVTYTSSFWWSLPKQSPDRVKDVALFSRHITDPERFAARASSSRTVYLVGKTTIEPADVLKAAVDIIDERDAAEEAKARKAASDALIGAYPPRALGRNS